MDVPQHTSNCSPSNLNKVYTFKNPYPQHFSILYAIIEYMIKNPSSGKVWKKLIKTCKFFYSKNPVLPVGALDVICDMKCRADGECFDTTLSFPNLWIFDSLKANNDSVQTIIYDCVQLIVPKILKFELRILNVKAQELTWSDYQKLTSSGTIKEINLRDCRICNSEGRIATAEKLLENLPNLEVIELKGYRLTEMFDRDTTKKMVDLFSGLEKLHHFKLDGVPRNFDFPSISNFLLKNESIDFCLVYNYRLPNDYHEMIDTVRYQIYQNSRLKVPVFQFLR